MRNSKKLISIILAVVLTVSCVTCIAGFSASAASDKFTITVKSNFFPERTETFSSDTETVTVSYYIKSNQVMVNSQWNLSFDPSVLVFNEEDGVNCTKVYYDEEDYIVDPGNISPVAKEHNYVINTGKVALGEIHGNNSEATPAYSLKRSDDSKIGFVTVTFNVAQAQDTEVNLELVELLTNKGQIYKFSESQVDDIQLSFETQSSVYEGLYDPDYENTDEPVVTYLIGDVNGDSSVDVIDATLIRKYCVLKATFDERQEYVADVNDDGRIDISDATDIQKYSVSKITEFKKK